MTDNEKWELCTFIESFIEDNFDIGSVDAFLDEYEKKKSNIWCRDGHVFIPDQCNRREHDYCKYCRILKEEAAGG